MNRRRVAITLMAACAITGAPVAAQFPVSDGQPGVRIASAGCDISVEGFDGALAAPAVSQVMESLGAGTHTLLVCIDANAGYEIQGLLTLLDPRGVERARLVEASAGNGQACLFWLDYEGGSWWAGESGVFPEGVSAEVGWKQSLGVDGALVATDFVIFD